MIDAKTDKQRTALHIAAYNAHTRILEKLVHYGAALNVQDTYGDTPLHDVLSRDVVITLSDETPQLKKVCDTVNFFLRSLYVPVSVCVCVCVCVFIRNYHVR